MKKIAFIGGYDKLDLIHYVGIILHNLGKKVLIVDTTRMQKSRYITPTIDNTEKQYIATAQGVDIAIGFRTYTELVEVTKITDESYDYMFIDIDNYKVLQTFNLTKEDMMFLTTTFDVYSLKIGLGVLSQFQNKEIVNKIVLAKNITPYHVQYLTHITKDFNITWGNISIFFPYDNGDLTIMFENQREQRMSLNQFSKDFLGSLLDLTVIIEPTLAKQIRKFIRTNSKIIKK